MIASNMETYNAKFGYKPTYFTWITSITLGGNLHYM